MDVTMLAREGTIILRVAQAIARAPKTVKQLMSLKALEDVPEPYLRSCLQMISVRALKHGMRLTKDYGPSGIKFGITDEAIVKPRRGPGRPRKVTAQ